MYIILLGAPGAGKGTQAVMLADKLSLVQVASGDLFRQALRDETELGLRAKAYLASPGLSSLPIWLLLLSFQRISQAHQRRRASPSGQPSSL